MSRICRHPVTRFSALEPSVKGAVKLWHRCVSCGLPVLVKVYYGGVTPSKSNIVPLSITYQPTAPKQAA